MIDQRTLLDCGENTERHGNYDRQKQSGQRQFGRGRQAARDFGRYGASRRQRIAEIAMREIADIAQELIRKRPIEPQ